MKPNKLQRLIDATPVTDPWPTREFAVVARPRRRWWHWLRALLPLWLMGCSCFGVTFFYNQYGQITGQWAWPEDYQVWIFRPDINWSNPNLPRPPRTPFPATPAPTPVPSGH